jgi:hypothetical protein
MSWGTLRLICDRAYLIAVAARSLTATIADSMKQLLSASPQTVKVTFHADAVFRDSTGPYTPTAAHHE